MMMKMMRVSTYNFNYYGLLIDDHAILGEGDDETTELPPAAEISKKISLAQYDLCIYCFCMTKCLALG